MDPSPGTGSRQILRSPSFWLSVICAAGMLAWAARPIEDDQEGTNTVGFAADILSNYAKFGFASVEGRPLRLSWPTRAPSGYTTLNHPPGLYWILWASVGDRYRVPFWLRLPATLVSIAVVFHLARAASRKGGEIAGCVVVLTLATSRLWRDHGGMAGFEPFLVGAGAAAFAEARRSGGSRWWVLASIGAVAVFVDWIGVALAASCLCARILSGGGLRDGIRVIFQVLAGAGLALVAIAAIDSCWAGGLGAAFEQVNRAAASAAAGSIADALSFQARILVSSSGWLAVILAGAGCVWWIVSFLRRVPSRPGLALAADAVPWLVLATAALLAFPARAGNHEYWCLAAAPAIALGAGAASSSLFLRTRPWVQAAALILFTGVQLATVPRGGTVFVELGPGPRQFAAQVDAAVPADSLVLFPTAFEHGWNWRYYTQAVARPAVDPGPVTIAAMPGDLQPRNEAPFVRAAIARFKSGEFLVSHLYVVADKRAATDSRDWPGGRLAASSDRYDIWRIER